VAEQAVKRWGHRKKPASRQNGKNGEQLPFKGSWGLYYRRKKLGGETLEKGKREGNLDAEAEETN